MKRRNLFISKIYIIYKKKSNGEIASGAEYRMDKQSQNWPIFKISIVFQIGKILKIC